MTDYIAVVREAKLVDAKFKSWLKRELKEYGDVLNDAEVEDLSRLLPIEGYLKDLVLINAWFHGYCHFFLFDKAGHLLREWDEWHYTPSLGEIDEVCKEVGIK